MTPTLTGPFHPTLARRDFLYAGAIGVMGLTTAHVNELRAEVDEQNPRRKSVIFIWLTGGLAQHDSFDMKPDAPDDIRGAFKPVSTITSGLQICEHLPRLAKISDKWALLRSLTHPHNEHADGSHVMCTGRTNLPPGFRRTDGSTPDNFPSMTSIARFAVAGHNSLPSSMVLPNVDQRPGQLAGRMGSRYDPWVVNARTDCICHGNCPDCFDHQHRKDRKHAGQEWFRSPNLSLPEELTTKRLRSRVMLLDTVERQQRQLDGQAAVANMNRHRDNALALLTSAKTRAAFDIELEPAKVREAYGRCLFGDSLLLARRLVEAGVGMLQVNLGRLSTWDTHGNAFPHLKDKLLPPMDRALAALISDLDQRGLLDDTLLVMAGEFGRTPKITHLPQHYDLPGRDHWGATQSVLLAGGGVRGGAVVGSSDSIGAYPASLPKSPEHLAATIYRALGIPSGAVWYELERPHQIYNAEPIDELYA